MTPERWRRVEEVFHGAVERDAASRERFLAEACAGDEALKRDVEALLSTDGEAADFIETPAAAALADEPAEAAKLAPGERLGPYEVASLIGRGGMGEVYRARDTRLGRDVAIKVLPSLMASDPDRLRRLELEARTTGMLNHPNILSIHDTGVHGGSAYLVTELLSGKTLRELLAGGALPARRALDVAAQTARGLAAAHDKGIVHRDLKPENLFVTKEGLVKILDFGLAKLTGPRIASGSATGAATVSARTATGMILGTAGYMSPEQVRGQAVDHRSDVFAFGAILYEMLTGRRAFAGDSAVETMHAILKEEPPEPEPDLRVPPALERIVRRCLEKSPEHRFQSARDVGFALEAFGAPTGSGEAVAGPRPARAPTSRTAVLTALAAASVAALAAALLTARATRTEPPVFTRITFRRGTIASARFSPDGQTIVYAGAFSGRPAELFATRPGSPESRSFDLPEAEILGISSAGEMAIRLASEWTLARVPLVGGAPREVAHGVQAADFSPDGESLAAVRWEGDHPRLEYPLGTRLYDSPNELSSPCVSPDGGSVAFLESPSRFSTSSLVCIVDRAGRRRVLSSEAGWNGGLGWSAKGELLFVGHRLGISSTLYALKPGGKARPLLSLDGYVKLLDVDRKGHVLLARDDMRTQVLLRGPSDSGERELSWLDSSYAADLSDDGKLLLLVEDGAGGGSVRATYLRKTDGSAAVRLGDGGGLDLSPDGASVLLLKPGPPSELWLVPTRAGSPRRLPTAPLDELRTGTWFEDGKRILVIGAEPGHGPRGWVLEAREGAPAPRPITPEGINVAMGARVVSPDGAFLAAKTRGAAFLYPIGGGGERPIPVDAREEPLRFSADGKALYTRVRGLPTRILRLDLASGKKELVRELMPADPSGVRVIRSVILTPDAGTYAYTFERVLSELTLVDLKR